MSLVEKINTRIYEPVERFVSVVDNFDNLFVDFGSVLWKKRDPQIDRLVSVSPPRSMTTFLYRQLMGCVGLYLPPNKETNYLWAGWQVSEEIDRAVAGIAKSVAKLRNVAKPGYSRNRKSVSPLGVAGAIAQPGRPCFIAYDF